MKAAIYCVGKNALKLGEKIYKDKRYKSDIYISKRIFEPEKNKNYI